MKRKSKTGHRPLTGIGRLRIGLLLGCLFVLLLLLAAGGCTQTDVEENVIPPHALPDVATGFNLNVLASRPPVTRSITFAAQGTLESDSLAADVKDAVRTKAADGLTEAEESQIASLWVGQYDAATGKRLFNQYLPSLMGTTVNLKLKRSQDGSKSRVYFVSNAGDLGAIADEATLKQHTLSYASTGEGLPDNRLCKMMGVWEGVVVAGGVKDITVELIRLLAKITFAYSTGSGFTFTPSSVQLKNAPTLSQVEAPARQLTTGVTYKTYTGTASPTGATVYWYLPENMAGTVSGDNAVDSQKKKTGRGVTNATCIELTGDAVQGGVTYKDVTFRFYPGGGMNNYDIIRNGHYTMAVTFVGIDVSDERITVGEIPDIEVDPTEIPACKGGEKAVQITARPGQPWVFDMPLWLSALLNGEEIPSGATIEHQGPATVLFRAAEANPKAEKRAVSFTIDVNGTDHEITITQTGSTLSTGNKVSLAAEASSEGGSSFTATAGLPWSAALSGEDWLGWSASNPVTSGSEASGEADVLKVKSGSSNPSAMPRMGTIVVKGGASVVDASYAGLKREIAVEQSGSTVAGSTLDNIAAKGATGDASFTATKGLAWTSSVTSGNWITLNSGASGSLTTGSAQIINYTAAVNSSSSARSGTIVVRAGDPGVGPTGNITLGQAGSTLSVSEAAKTIPATASTGNTSSFTATQGLSWSVGVASTGSWLSLSESTSGTDNSTGAAQTITYSASLNPNASTRQGTITVKAGNAVSGTDAGLTKTITVTQEASSFSASGGSSTIAGTGGSTTGQVSATTGLAWTVSPASQNGISVIPTSGSGNATLTFTGSANIGTANTVWPRTGSFTISVAGASPARSATVAATQAAGATNQVTINSTVVASYKAKTTDYAMHPPFNYDGGAVSGTMGSDRNGVSSSCTLSKTYSIEVEKTERGSPSDYATSVNYCKGKGSGWRVPTMIELKAIYDNKTTLENNGCAPFVNSGYRSSSVYQGTSDIRSRVIFPNGNFGGYGTSLNQYVRCVRDL